MKRLEKAEKFVEYQINHEEKVEIDEQDAQNTPFEEGEVVRDNIDCDHRKTLEEAKEHFFLEEEHWSIEKLERWAINGDEVKREYSLVEESN